MIAKALSTVVLFVSIPAQEQIKPNALQVRVAKLVETFFDEDQDPLNRAESASQLTALGVHASRPLIEGYLKAEERWHYDPLMKRTLLAMGAGAEPGIKRLVDEILAVRVKTCPNSIRLMAEVGPWSKQIKRLVDEIDYDTLIGRLRPQPGGSRGEDMIMLSWLAVLQRSDLEPSTSTEGLIKLLNKSHYDQPFVVSFAIDLLAKRSTDAGETIPVLASLHERPPRTQYHIHRATFTIDAECREAAARALLAIAPEDIRSFGAMVWLLKHSPFRSDKLVALRVFGVHAKSSDSKTSARGLAALLEHLSDYYRREVPHNLAVVIMLGQLGPKAKAALKLLDEMEENVGWSDELEAAILRALEQIRKT